MRTTEPIHASFAPSSLMHAEAAAVSPPVGPLAAHRRPRLSIITPAYNEERNLPVLYERLRAVLDKENVDWEWIVTDDHSSDRTFEVLAELGRRDMRVRVLRFSRNFGSHAGVSCGLRHARGDCAGMLAADLQDPPEVLPQLLEKWRAGGQVVWAVRGRREGEGALTLRMAGLFYWIMRNVVGMREMAATGADLFLIDRRVIEAYREFEERNVNVFALLTWMGFKQDTVIYTKEARLHGSSGWTLQKKLKLAVDSVTSFSYLPIRVMSWTGMFTAIAGLCYAIFIIGYALIGRSVEGWASLMVVVLVLGGFQMLMLGILGEYLWRALDEARRRPSYTVEAEAGAPVWASSAAPPTEQVSPGTTRGST
jgi:polyisoprenyl-phosphate glycosyltransferase